MGKTVQIYGFPTFVSAENVKLFLEGYTGHGTVYALKIGHPQKKGKIPRVYATVQFTTTECVEKITARINMRLRYGSTDLKIWNMELDIVRKPKASIFNSEVTAVHFGNQVSNERFLVLWKQMGAVVNFGVGLRKIVVHISHVLKEYTIEYSYDSIWEIQLRRPRNQRQMFLLIQVLTAPRIHEKPLCSSSDSSEAPSLTYFKDTVDDQWVRTIDFTEESYIGQSSAICLELPLNWKDPGIRENFHYYKEDDGKFSMESGSTFSCNLDLVPIVGPPQGLDLPFDILFKINSLVQSGCLAGPTLNAAFYGLVDPRHVPNAHIELALERLYALKTCCYDPIKWLNEQYKVFRKSKRFMKSPSYLTDGVVNVRRVEITPSKVYFCGPEVIVSNRVLRKYHGLVDNFIRVSFVDEDGKKMWSTDLSPRTLPNETKRHTDIYKRILSTLSNGIVVGEKKFEFLAYSSSQLKDNSVWMFASRNGVTAASIREWMGNFREIKNVAKYAARLGQSFGSSRETLTVSEEEKEIIPDVKSERNGVEYVFSDGIGKICPKLAKAVAKKCGIKSSTPSAFQIRYAGYKGVVAVDPTAVKKLLLRKSMFKYTSNNKQLDVLAWSKFQPCFLNRQLITLLSTLGVQDQVFEKKQKAVVDQLDMILTDSDRALEALEIMSPGENTNVLREMLRCGYKPDTEPYLSMMLQTFRKSKLLELRKKSRIYIPDGRSLMGCLDETRTLEYGQVFVQVSHVGGRKDHGKAFHRSGQVQRMGVVEGPVVVAKNPCLHPGDIRVLQAVNITGLHHMVDCVVFPQKGSRPHPNECSGSDLDGDIYFVSWDPELIPPRQVEPMDYTPAAAALLDHDVTMEEVQEYFTKYMVNDSLGIIANAHTAFADKEPLKAESDACIELAKLFSIAVDFSKTGVPADIPSRLYVREYPDFMEKLDKPTYESQRVIGKLFREVKDMVPQTITSFTWEVAKRCYDRDMEVEGFEYYLDDACYYKEKYDLKLGKLMEYYGMKSEAEILTRGTVKPSMFFNRKQDLDAIGAAVRSLRKEARSWLEEKGDESSSNGSGYVYAKASACYHVTYHPNYWGRCNEGTKWDHFLSFPWCIYDKLIHIKQEKIKKEYPKKAAKTNKNRRHQPLEQQFRRVMGLS